VNSAFGGNPVRVVEDGTMIHKNSGAVIAPETAQSLALNPEWFWTISGTDSIIYGREVYCTQEGLDALKERTRADSNA